MENQIEVEDFRKIVSYPVKELRDGEAILILNKKVKEVK